MTPKELKRILIKNGWTIQEGGNHSLATNPQKPGVKIPIPRHNTDIPTGTLKNILRSAGLGMK